MKKFHLALITVLVFITNAKADSPLTTSCFYKAYSDVSIIQEASKSKGKLTIRLMDYLSDSSKPIDIKVAIINQIGWDIKGKNNSKLLLKYIFKKRSYKTIQEFKNGRADDLICYAYTKGMDNYFNVEEAYNYSKLAVIKDPNSYTVNIISLLLKSQSQEGCEIYNTMNKIRKRNNLKMDFRLDAIRIIFEYTDIYNKDCNLN